MASSDDKQKRQRKAKEAAAFTVVFVAVFSFAFMGLVIILNDYADHLEQERSRSPETIQETLEEPFYVLLIGSNSLKGTAVYNAQQNGSAQMEQHADVITLMRIDPKGYKITLLTVPRDTVLDGYKDKINASLNSGNPEDVVEIVWKLTGIRADYYMMTTYIVFENLINSIGGVDVTVSKTVTKVDPATGKNVTVKQGKNQHLNGSQALALACACEEYEWEKQDPLRQVNVRRIERAMIEKVLNTKNGIKVEDAVAALSDDLETNLDLPSAGALMMQFVEHAADVVIYDGTGTYEGEVRAKDGEWVVPEDEEAWEEMVRAVNEGQNPSEVIEPPSF